MRPLYIFDIDGTLADNRHRNHLIEKHPKCERCAGTGEYFCHTDFGSHTCDLCDGSGKLKGWRPDWNKWYSLAEFDKPNVAVVRILGQLCMLGDLPNIHDVDKPEIWFFTGRPEEHRELTTTWLTINTAIYREELIHGQLVMRTTGDYRPDYIVKQEMVDRMLAEDRKRLVCVFDDRQQVVDMWRRNGIACLQVAPGNF